MAQAHLRHKAQLAGVFVMLVGRGWIAGVFSIGNPWWTALVLSVPIVLPLVLGLAYFHAGEPPRPWRPDRWASIGMHVYAALSLLLAVLSLLAGQIGAAIQEFGVRTPAEIVPTIIIAGGALTWLAALMWAPRPRTRDGIGRTAETL